MESKTLLETTVDSLAAETGKGAADRVFGAFKQRTVISRDLAHQAERESKFGDRLADRVAEIGGSWGFVSAFGVFLLVWALLNLLILPHADRFDPYPFIFLNLILSMLAAIQAPIIMMSQNRQSAKDRIEARHDFEVNLKAELEILTLHEKLDRLHQEHGAQLAALRALLEGRAVQA